MKFESPLSPTRDCSPERRTTPPSALGNNYLEIKEREKGDNPKRVGKSSTLVRTTAVGCNVNKGVEFAQGCDRILALDFFQIRRLLISFGHASGREPSVNIMFDLEYVAPFQRCRENERRKTIARLCQLNALIYGTTTRVPCLSEHGKISLSAAQPYRAKHVRHNPCKTAVPFRSHSSQILKYFVPNTRLQS